MILPSASAIGWLLAFAAAVAYAIPALLASRASEALAMRFLRLAWVLHAAALVTTWLSGIPPRFGFAPALSMTAWLVMTVYAIERQMFPQLRTRWALAALSALAVLLAAVFPGQRLHLQASPWLPLHLALGVASYGLFAAAVVHAVLMRHADKQIRNPAAPPGGLPLLTLERLTFRFVMAGFVLLSATLLAGWLFGDVLYGNPWHWDHKTVFSLLSWVTFAVLLIGRRRFGWRGRSAANVLYAGAALLLLAYVGSRFVLEVVLHRS